MARHMGWRPLLVLMPAIGIAGMLVVVWLSLAVFKATYGQDHEKAAQERVELAEGVIRRCYELERQGKLTRAAAQDQAKESIRRMTTREGHYLWINDTGPAMVMHPFRPELEGRSLADYRDPQGKLVFVAMVDLVRRSGDGFVEYSWPQPNSRVAVKKRSYVKLFEPWQWVIGSGIYGGEIDRLFWRRSWPLIPIIAGVSLVFVAVARAVRRQVLISVGGEIDNAAAIARHLAAGNPDAPIHLSAAEHGASLRAIDRWRQRMANIFGAAAARRRREEAERRRLGEALKQSQEVILLAEADLQLAYVNPAFTRLFGYTLEEVVGQSVRLLEVAADWSTGPQETAEMACETGLFRGEVLRRSKDGREIPVLVNVAPVCDDYQIITGYVATMTDLTEIRRAQAALRESEEKFRAIFGQTFQFIGLLTPDGKVIDANDTALDMAGLKLAEVSGKPLWDTPWFSHAAALQAQVRDAVARAAKDEFVRFETWHPKADGGVRHMDFSLKPLHAADGRIEMLIPEGHDITERKLAGEAARRHLEQLARANQELRELNAKLEEAHSQLLQSEKMASIGVLAAGVAHEINNPVGFIQSNMHALDKYVTDFLGMLDAYQAAEAQLSDRKEAFAEIRRLRDQTDFAFERDDVVSLLSESREGLARVVKIVKDLKDFSHIDAVEEWRDEDLHQGLDSTLNVVWNELKYKCEVKKDYGALPRVECLLPQLNQVFMNLLVNAAQAIKEHGTVTVRTGCDGDRVRVEISDTGQGIPAENLKRIFDPFFTTKPVGTGTGLGLSVSYGIVQKHHGSIEVESEPGKGTTFRIWLPRRQPKAVEA